MRVVTALAIAAMLALGAVACGEDSGTTAETTGADTASRGQGAEAKDQGNSQQSPNPNKQGSGGDGGGQSATPTVEPAPLEVSGGGSGQFRVKGGDNSIQNWGEEDEGGLPAAAEAVHDFYVARAEEDWQKACSYLAESLLEQLEQLAQQGGTKASCPALLEGLTPPLLPSVRRETTVVDAGSLRVGEEASFLIYRGVGGVPYAMALENEDGAWKLTLLSPNPIG